jgi:hypothetical protein
MGGMKRETGFDGPKMAVVNGFATLVPLAESLGHHKKEPHGIPPGKGGKGWTW